MIYRKVFSYFLANNSSVPPTSSSALYLFSFLFVCFLVFPLLLLLLSHCGKPWIFGCCNQMMFWIKLPLTNRNARDKSGQSDIMESFFPLRIDRHIECLYFLSRLLWNDRILFGTAPAWKTLPLTAWTFSRIRWKRIIQQLYVLLSILIFFFTLFVVLYGFGSVILLFKIF